jgi:hypothetical protein
MGRFAGRFAGHNVVCDLFCRLSRGRCLSSKSWPVRWCRMQLRRKNAV